jgi:hypothetical protein
MRRIRQIACIRNRAGYAVHYNTTFVLNNGTAGNAGCLGFFQGSINRVLYSNLSYNTVWGTGNGRGGAVYLFRGNGYVQNSHITNNFAVSLAVKRENEYLKPSLRRCSVLLCAASRSIYSTRGFETRRC